MAKTSASFTLMDYTDGISLITGIDSNLPLTSLYDTRTRLSIPRGQETPRCSSPLWCARRRARCRFYHDSQGLEAPYRRFGHLDYGHQRFQR